MPIIAQLMTMKEQTRCLQLKTYLWLYFGILGFTIIMTISDPEGTAPVYDEMRFIVSSTGAQISDIQTAARITQRI